ncbi:alpha/beta fold hydrolase [Hansschlegelia beijingensis]|uniref:Pimeloyl-ACP methyl ester carboxylesterase n=1 Tax=Hansschlegelia beijingensis TaxID=1133344 RepID=A0A7W6CZ04_9HYPH|nr:alpha/beta hydrolase [Hansschlegelia beijingensis]MBB3973641.1 pimeloyl-ACP methyl ester carboxylesterase [Hansschlegelia beijingensis]
MTTMRTAIERRSVIAGIGLGGLAGAAALADEKTPTPAGPTDEAALRFGTRKVGDVTVFYREAGRADAPVLLLLHGFPTAGHMFRDLIPKLADRYRVIAPDLAGFGNTVAPPRASFDYSFDALAQVTEGFVEAMGLTRYALYVFDYGAPTGYRLAMAHPERVTAIISQNGNAYTEGFSAEWGPWEAYWRDPSPENREACRASLTDEAIRFQYLHGAPEGRVSPDGMTLDMHYMRRPEAQEIQLDLILSYRTNVALYPDFQAYFRKHQPPLLAVWGRNDAFFIPAGAKAYARDLPKAEIHLIDAGHFALETHSAEIARRVRSFLERNGV